MKNFNEFQINETFDPYDFKVYDKEYLKYNQDIYAEILNCSIDIPKSDYELIDESMYSCTDCVVTFVNNWSGRKYYVLLELNRSEYIIIHYFGDYCYSMTIIDEVTDNLNKVIVCDTMESLLNELDNYIIGNIVSGVNESFDPYDFKVYTSDFLKDKPDFYDMIKDHSQEIEEEDLDNLIASMYSINTNIDVVFSNKWNNQKGHVLVEFDGSVYLIIHYYGDYCFNIAVISESNDDMISSINCDGFDILIEEIEKIINNDLNGDLIKESFVKYNFGTLESTEHNCVIMREEHIPFLVEDLDYIEIIDGLDELTNWLTKNIDKNEKI